MQSSLSFFSISICVLIRKTAMVKSKSFSSLHHHHHQLNVHFLPRLIKGMDGCFPTALGTQSTFSNSDISVPEIIKVPVPILFHDYELSFQFRSSSVPVLKKLKFSIPVPFHFHIYFLFQFQFLFEINFSSSSYSYSHSRMELLI